MSKISKIIAQEILDSRGYPTIWTKVISDDGSEAYASVPSGASTGTYEAFELRDGDKKRYNGRGVLQAVKNVNEILSSELSGFDPSDQAKIDKKMIDLDGTENKRKLGANSILSVSLGVAKLSAKIRKIPLYKYLQTLSKTTSTGNVTPMFNIINGGLHGCGKLSIQEFLIIPRNDLIFEEKLRMGTEIYQLLKKILKDNKNIYSVGDEGGFTPDVSSITDAIDLILQAVKNSGYSYGKDIYLGLDFASSTYFTDNKYKIDDNNQLDAVNYIDYLIKLKDQYNLLSMEDPLSEDDWDSWKILTDKISQTTEIIGDDLLVTNKNRLQKAIDSHACNCVLVKVNQIGTLSETLEVIELARSAGFKIIISHRSGETTDDFISDLAVAAKADFVKFGAPARGERVIKYNRLLSIDRNL